MRAGSRRMALVWLSALLIACLVAGGFFALMTRAYARSLDGMDAAFIGSSLFRHGLHDPAAAPPALADAAPRMVRFGQHSATELELLALARMAAARDGGLIFVEANQIVARLRVARQDCSTTREAERLFQRFRRFVVASLDFNPPHLPGLGVVEGDRAQVLDPERMARSYPLVPRAACRLAAWKALVAGPGGGRIRFVLMPRSAAGAAMMDAARQTALLKAADVFAAAVGAPLLKPAPKGFWPDAFFIDEAHLNKAGALRFQRWLAGAWPGTAAPAGGLPGGGAPEGGLPAGGPGKGARPAAGQPAIGQPAIGRPEGAPPAGGASLKGGAADGLPAQGAPR